LRTQPYFTQNGRYLIAQVKDSVFVIDVTEPRIHLKLSGYPVGISRNDTLLLMRQQNAQQSASTSVYSLDTATSVPLSEVDRNSFDTHQRLYFSDYLIGERVGFPSRVQPKSLQFRDAFDGTLKVVLQIGTGVAGTGVSEHMHTKWMLFKTLGAPFVVFTGWWDTDWGGYDYVWVGNLDTSAYVHEMNMMEDAPVHVNYTPASKRLALVTGDGVTFWDANTSKASVVHPPQHFTTHSQWRGNDKYSDAVAHPFASNRAIVAEINGWRDMASLPGGAWVGDTIVQVDSKIRTLAYHPDGEKFAIITEDDFRLYHIEIARELWRISIT
jgi:hypothetical protein